MAGGTWLWMLLLACTIACCSSMYQDQVGMSDWHQQYIGRATHASFQTQGSGRKRVVVATDKNIVASLNLRTGEIFWRQALAEREHIDGLEIVHGKHTVSLSGGGYLRAWHLPDGALIWDTLLPSTSPSAQLTLLPVDLNNDRLNDLVVLQDKKVYAVSSGDGRIIWTADLEDESFTGKSLAFKESAIYVAGISESSLAVYRLDAATGRAEALKIDGAHQSVSASGLTITSGSVVGLDSNGVNIITGAIGNQVRLRSTPLADLLPAGAEDAILAPAQLTGGFAISTKQGVFVVELSDSSGLLKVQKKFQHPASLSDSLELGEGTSAFAVVQSSGTVRVVKNDWSDISEDVVEIEGHRGLLQKLFLSSYTRTDRSRGYRVLVVGEDDSLGLLQQGKIVWAREDALASIVDTTVAELPVEKAGVSVANVEHGLAAWLSAQFLRLKATVTIASGEELSALQKLRMNSAEKTKMVRDHNGFRKLIVTLTSSGKLFALHSGDGRIVWSLLLPLFKSSSFSSLKLFPWQIPHHHALDENPVVLALGTSDAAGSALSWVDVHTGKEERSVQLPYSVKQAIQLPVTDSSERRLHLLIDHDEKAHLFPATDESLSLFSGHIGSTFYFSARKDAGVIEGFSIEARIETGNEREHGYTFSTKKIWSVVFPRDTEAIATVVTGRPDEVVHTQAKVLGNRDVLYKYLNKNMIFVATVTPRAADAVGAANPEETWLNAYLIDGVTGLVLHRVSHPNAQAPVHAVLSENWVVYEYFNARSQRVEMSVLEVYDKSAQDGKDVVQLMLGRYNTSVPFSSFTRRSLEVKSQSYFFSSTIKTMTATTTARGITGKQILIGTVGNQVIALDKRFFDPRRSLAPTPAEREEGIIPLTDGLPVFPMSYISHAARVEGLRGIVSVPARLESTCLVFAYGTDLFYTRTAPSRTYDSLTEDFNYALLLITILVLVVAIVITWTLSHRKDLREKWS